MPIQRAVTAFQTKQFNCAQSILHAFRKERGISEQTIQQARQLGGGRAEAGRCGALYAALQMVDDPMRTSVRESFVARAGTEKCREIRGSRALTCVQCVELAATLLTACHEDTEKHDQG